MSVKRKYVLLCFVLAATVSAGCGGAGGSSDSGESGTSEDSSGTGGSSGETLTISGAASLTDAFEELGETFAEQTGAEVQFNFGSSSELATQIVQGAPADVFASADQAQMENVAGEDLIEGEPEIFARNREVVIVPADNPGNIQEFADLAEPGLTLVLADEEVPAAEYAEEILANASEDPEYGDQFGQDVMDNIASREADVRASVNRVVIGDADGTFGYASDVTPDIREEVEVIEIPQNLQVVAEYPVAALAEAQNPELAQQWIELVTSEEGQQVLEDWGFEPVN